MSDRLGQRAGCAALLALLCGCGPGGTLLYVDVTARDGVGAATDLVAKLKVAEETFQATFVRNDGAPVFGPSVRSTQFLIRADGREGPAELSVTARDAQGRPLGAGTSTAFVEADHKVDVPLVLFPWDFQVNTTYPTNQFFTTTAAGRQLASDSAGNFLVVWEDSGGVAGRFDVYARLFDPQAAPRTSATTSKTDDFVVNQEGQEVYDQPAVGMQGDGSFVFVWRRGPAGSPGKVYSRAFTADGRPTAATGNELQLSETFLGEAATPDIAALGDQSYAVVWAQEKKEAATTTWVVDVRLLDAQGRPAENSAGKTLPLQMATFPSETSDLSKCDTDARCPNVAVAAGPTPGSFFAVWRQQGNLYGRAFRPKGTPVGQSIQIAKAPTGLVRSFNLTGLQYGYAVAWSDRGSCGADKDGTCVKLRRFAQDGAPLEDEWVFNTTTAGNQDAPALAARPDGSVLVVFASSGNLPEDPQGGIRGRRLLSNGLPVGGDFPINATTHGEQRLPSVAPVGKESFAVVFEDKSGAGPDTFEGGIRGRLIYPDYGPSDGQVGALCAPETPCSAGLQCASTQVGPRCVATCGTPGSTCPHGGRCLRLSGEQTTLCLYQ
ncbi:MAG: hypothetical protein IT371_14135 [Deltaproteobacteria bacterium]|nr:hypothetical protein [Deltaproteobacteria bacterium]